MNPLFKRATGLLQSRATGAPSPMAQPKTPSGVLGSSSPSGGGLIDRLRARTQGTTQAVPKKKVPMRGFMGQ